MNQIYFTADSHFGHINIMKHCHRPFKTIQEMDATIIRNWNERVSKRDLVYHLGDFAFRCCDYYLNQLNGRIRLILGNHDDNLTRACKDRFVAISHAHYLCYNGHQFWLAHYPHRSWRNSCHGSYHLFGHCHGTMPDYGLSTDIGVDRWGFRPVSIGEIIEYFASKQSGGELVL